MPFGFWKQFQKSSEDGNSHSDLTYQRVNVQHCSVLCEHTLTMDLGGEPFPLPVQVERAKHATDKPRFVYLLYSE